MEVGIGEVGEDGRFTFHFLHIILAEFAQPQGVGIADNLRREDFRNSEKPNLCGVAAHAGARFVDSFVYGLKSLSEGFRQAGKVSPVSR